MTGKSVWIDADAMRAFGAHLLTNAGMAADIAAAVSGHVIDANLAGVDSHGCVRFPYYLGLIANREIEPLATPTIADDRSSTCIIDGGGNLGMPAMILAAEEAGRRARDHGVAAIAVRNVMHTGRIGAYAATVAQCHCFCFITGGGGHQTYRNVAPFGAREGGFSTNPVAMAMPAGGDGDRDPVMVDFATSATAQGKLMLARANGRNVPDGQIIDRKGQPTTDPEDFYQGGIILPAAGPKGSGLALMAELIGYGMLGDPREFNWLMLAVDLSAFAAKADYDDRTAHYLDGFRALAPMAGFERVQVPGEPEVANRRKRLASGIPVPQSVMRELRQHALALNVAVPDGIA